MAWGCPSAGPGRAPQVWGCCAGTRMRTPPSWEGLRRKRLPCGLGKATLDTFTKATVPEFGAEMGASGDVKPASSQAPEGAIRQGHPAEGGEEEPFLGGLGSVLLTQEPGSPRESEGKGRWARRQGW